MKKKEPKFASDTKWPIFVEHCNYSLTPKNWLYEQSTIN